MDDLLARYDRQVRRRPRDGAVERPDHVVRVIGDGWRSVLWSDLAEDNADGVIAREIERFQGLGEWEWKLYSYDTPRDLPDRLRAAGFVPEAEETLLVGDLSELALDSPPPDGVALVAVEDEQGVELLLRAHDDVYGGHDPGYARAVRDAVTTGRAQAVVAMAGDRPICGGRIEWYEGTEFAGLYGGSTVPDWRRRGVFRAVVGYRAALARARGYRYLQVDASDDSRPILERLGFVPLATTTPFIHA
jgi:GNAT superfamily N-acetyltransferase